MICHEEPENVPSENCSNFWRVLTQWNVHLYCIAPLINASIALLKSCQQLNFVHTAFDCGLQKSSNFDHMVCNVISAVGRAHEMYISSPASPDYWITFLHLVLS